MGQSQPTVSDQIDAYREQHAAFRQWLTPAWQRAFDEHVAALYRARPALNVTEDLDFRRRALLVNVIRLIDRSAEQQKQLDALERSTASLEAALGRLGGFTLPTSSGKNGVLQV